MKILSEPNISRSRLELRFNGVCAGIVNAVIGSHYSLVYQRYGGHRLACAGLSEPAKSGTIREQLCTVVSIRGRSCLRRWCYQLIADAMICIDSGDQRYSQRVRIHMLRSAR